MMKNPVRKKSSLWLLGISPLVWAIHFLFAYVYAAVWCAKFAGRTGTLDPVRSAVFIATVIALLIVGIEFFIGWKKNRLFQELPERERFLGLARLLISGLSFLAILYTAYVSWFFRSCV